ncbi:MAG TPA: hexitol phosphatase HxpB [Candidatus Dormibacteraeota bacterium]|nr:hexitol phosphatase HxpB [Candidatus Dormibacteraeota bacterium]
MIRAAIFDMDGLLIDSEPLWKRTNYETFKTLGIEITAELRHNMMGRTSAENVAYLYGQHPWKGPSLEEVETMIRDEIIRLVKAEGTLKPGVHQALSVCKKAELSVAIASSSNQVIIDAVVDTLEIREHFDHIYSAQFEPYGKPHPGVFIKVAKHFKVRPEDCLVFEDSPSGVLAAKSARMVCVAVPEPSAKDNPFVQTADVILDSLEQFDTEILKNLG